MPAVSKDQQRASAIALDAKKNNKIDELPDGAAKEMAKSMTMKELGKLASTKHKGLPEKKKESVQWAGMSLAETMNERKRKNKVATAAYDDAFKLFFKDIMGVYEAGREAAENGEYSSEEFENVFDEESSSAENRQGWLVKEISRFNNQTAPNTQRKLFRELFKMFQDRAYLAGFQDKQREVEPDMNEEMIGVSDTDDPEEQIVSQKSKKERIDDKEIKNGKEAEDSWVNAVHGSSPALAHHSAGMMSSNTMGARVAESVDNAKKDVVFESSRWQKLANIKKA